MPGETDEDYVERRHKLRDVDHEEVSNIRRGLAKVPYRFASSHPKAAAQNFLAHHDNITFTVEKQSPTIVRLTVGGITEDFSRKLYCNECGSDASSRSRWFSGVEGLIHHISSAHELNAPTKFPAAASYVYEMCPYDKPNQAGVQDFIENGKPKSFVAGKKRSRDEMEDEGDNGGGAGDSSRPYAGDNEHAGEERQAKRMVIRSRPIPH